MPKLINICLITDTPKKISETRSSLLDQENLNLPAKRTNESKILTELTNETNTIIQANTNDENVLVVSKKAENIHINTVSESKNSFNLTGNFLRL
jgi:hypothetical protein